MLIKLQNSGMSCDLKWHTEKWHALLMKIIIMTILFERKIITHLQNAILKKIKMTIIKLQYRNKIIRLPRHSLNS